MSHEHVSPHDEQIPGSESLDDLRETRFRKIINSWPESAYEAVAALSSIMVGSSVSARVRAHTEQGDYERRVLIEELRKVNMNSKQIRFVFRHYGLKIPKDGLKIVQSS